MSDLDSYSLPHDYRSMQIVHHRPSNYKIIWIKVIEANITAQVPASQLSPRQLELN